MPCAPSTFLVNPLFCRLSEHHQRFPTYYRGAANKGVSRPADARSCSCHVAVVVASKNDTALVNDRQRSNYEIEQNYTEIDPSEINPDVANQKCTVKTDSLKVNYRRLSRKGQKRNNLVSDEILLFKNYEI